ncbi:MAG: glutamyl-tRNA reductase, partial [Gammaproteobacteria bacterium]|nr:glutamyl-tRNA reductase [Gammaproteobacteria bacterium]
MSIFVIGINHKTAPIHLREKVYFSLDKVSLYLQDLLSRGLASEAVLISTCNRSELYCEAEEAGVVRDWFYM